MPNGIIRYLKEFLFPNQVSDSYSRFTSPAEGLILAHELLHRLANQIESHAASAPYPDIARRLQAVAAQQYDGAEKLKTILESRGEKTRSPAGRLKQGINHWHRLNLDLQDQVALDDLLFTVELKADEEPEIAQIAKDLRISQQPNRQILADLIAIADPQATQT